MKTRPPSQPPAAAPPFDTKDYYRRLTEIDIGTIARELLDGRITHESARAISCDCPNHASQSRRSLQIWLDKQGWYCHGCSVGGDVLQLVEFVKSGSVTSGQSGPMPETHQQARQFLAERVELPKLSEIGLSPERLKQLEETRAQTVRTQEALGALARYYNQRLKSSPEVLNWVKDKYGLSDETIDDLLIGFADNTREKKERADKKGQADKKKTDSHRAPGALAHLTRGPDKFTNSDLAATGAFIPTSQNRLMPFFKQRIVFPFWHRGRVVFMTGRRTPWTPENKYEKSKYKKLPTHDARNRTYVAPCIHNGYIYNEDCLLDRPDHIVITEGITDCIAAMQAGIPCISPTTTTFRNEDTNRLVNLTQRTNRVIICNDSEASGAGETGAIKTARLLLSAGQDVRIAMLPRPDGIDKVDLCDYLKSNNVASLQAELSAAQRVPEYLLHKIPHATPKIELAPLLRPVLELISDGSPVDLDAYVDLISDRFKLARQTVQSQLKEVRRELAAKKRSGSNSNSHSHSHSRSGSQSGSNSRPSSQPDEACLKGSVLEARDHYYLETQDGQPIAVSSFRIEPTERVKLEHGEVVIGDITTTKRGVYRDIHFAPNAWHSKRNLLQALPSADMQWTGSDDNVQGVLRIISGRDVPIRRGTQVMGYTDAPAGPRWVAPKVVLGADGPASNDDLVYLSNGATFPTRVRYPLADPADWRKIARAAFHALLNLNEPAVVLPIIGWFFATPFKPRIMSILRHFPILMVWGTRESGKTSMLRDVFWRMFGVDDTEPFSVTETEFAIIKLLSSTNSVPLFFDEYRPDDMPPRRLATLHRYLRRLYGGEVEERGRPDLTITSYSLSAPVCIGGEARPEDPAVVDRLVSVTPNPNTLKQNADCRDAYTILNALPLGMIAAPYIQWCLGRLATNQSDTDRTAADLRDASSIADALINEIPNSNNISLRCRDNLRIVTFGLIMFETFAEEMLGLSADKGAALPDLDLKGALTACINDLMDGEQGAKTALDEFVETVAVMAYEGRLEEDKHWAVINNEVCVHLRSTWEIYLEQRRRAGKPDMPGGLRAIQRQLRESLSRDGYVKETAKVISMNGRAVKTIVLNLDQAGKHLDVDIFPEGNNREWGGSRRVSQTEDNQPLWSGY
ncbi:MAG: toprim domain-containing protein [Deltaproteobacteria bacterium]|nr:toprim domain-containing protein [Deltaproteobacteria bacterium]